jgi:uncharacterized protein (TIGR00251 family)
VAHSISSVDLSGAARWEGTDLILRVQLQPRASRDEFAGIHGNALKIRLTAPPVDGKANAALVAFLAEAFGVAKRQVALVQGETGRAKQLRIQAPTRFPPGLLAPPVRAV